MSQRARVCFTMVTTMSEQESETRSRMRNNPFIWNPLSEVTFWPRVTLMSTDLWRWTRASGLSAGHEDSARRWSLASTVPQQQQWAGAWQEGRRGCWGPEWRVQPEGSEGFRLQSEETLRPPWDWTVRPALKKLPQSSRWETCRHWPASSVGRTETYWTCLLKSSSRCRGAGTWVCRWLRQCRDRQPVSGSNRSAARDTPDWWRSSCGGDRLPGETDAFRFKEAQRKKIVRVDISTHLADWG